MDSAVDDSSAVRQAKKRISLSCSFFFFNDTATTEIYTLSLHDALPISLLCVAAGGVCGLASAVPQNAAIQRITPNHMRGRVTAIYLFMFIFFGAFGGQLIRSEEHTSELQSPCNLVCRLLLEKKKKYTLT